MKNEASNENNLFSKGTCSVPIEKLCLKCKSLKKIEQFHIKPNGKNNRSSKCIECESLYRKKLYKRKMNRKNKVLTILNDNEFVLHERQILMIWREIHE